MKERFELMDIGPTLNLAGAMYVDPSKPDDVALFDEVTSRGGPALAFGTIEDVDYIFESPTVVVPAATIVGASAIRSYYHR